MNKSADAKPADVLPEVRIQAEDFDASAEIAALTSAKGRRRRRRYLRRSLPGRGRPPRSIGATALPRHGRDGDPADRDGSVRPLAAYRPHRRSSSRQDRTGREYSARRCGVEPSPSCLRSSGFPDGFLEDACPLLEEGTSSGRRRRPLGRSQMRRRRRCGALGEELTNLFLTLRPY